MKAVVCPICQGDGSEWEKTDVKRGEPDKIWMKFCHGCNGKGWVEVMEDKPIDLIEEKTGQKQEDWSKCPTCGGDRNSPASTGCPMGSHYGSYSSL